MIRRLALIALVFITWSLHSQTPRAINTWRMHYGFTNAIELVEVGDNIIANGQFGLVIYNQETNEITQLDKSNGLSETNISTIAHDPITHNIVVAYTSSNIDIINFDKGISIVNFPEVKQKSGFGDKNIYQISFFNNLCYLSTGIGIIVLDLNKKEVRSTYKIGDNGEELAVYSTVLFKDQIVAACKNGIKNASINAANLQSFTNWKRDYEFNMAGSTIKHLQVFQQALFCNFKDSAILKFDNNQWVQMYSDTNFLLRKLSVYNQNLICPIINEGRNNQPSEFGFIQLDKNMNISKLFINKVQYPHYAILTAKGTTYLSGVGCITKVYDGGTSSYQINGPSNSAYQFTFRDDKIWISAGMPSGPFGYTLNKTGFTSYDGNYWGNMSLNTPLFKDIYDNMGLEIVKDTIFLACMYGGLIKLFGDKIVQYKYGNSILESNFGDTSTRVPDVKKDSKNNIWFIDYNATNPLKVYTSDGRWFKFNPPNLTINQKKIYIDSKDNKWMIDRNAGLVVFNEGSSFESTADDKIRTMPIRKVKCEVSESVHDVAEDKSGAYWVGTSKGIQIFNCGDLFSDNCFPYMPLVTKGEGKVDANDTFPECLLSYEVVLAIAVDGGNRKWCGTTSGVYLISADGKKELAHYTKENSPLPSNDIYDIIIHPKTGEVFIATTGGVVSFKGEATEGELTQEESFIIYPNPVTKDYEGVITIDRLVDQAYYKITDVSGNLVYQGRANGGRAVWNGKNYNGERPHSGIYFVFSTSEDGSETGVGKIIFER